MDDKTWMICWCLGQYLAFTVIYIEADCSTQTRIDRQDWRAGGVQAGKVAERHTSGALTDGLTQSNK
jgi:hypothetical protein